MSLINTGRDYPKLAWEKTAGYPIPHPEIDWLPGEGTEENPYCIDTADQVILLGKASILWDSHFVLGSDVDLTAGPSNEQMFEQAVIQKFSGALDGNGHRILGVTITGENYLGFFGRVESDGSIRNLGIEDVNIVGSSFCGGLVGWNSGNIQACYTTGSITGTRYVGGLLGYNNGSVARSYSTSIVSGPDWDTGGLVGQNDSDGYIASCYSNGTVSGSGPVGGLVGSNDGFMLASHSAGSVEGNTMVGGLVGMHSSGTVSNSCSEASVEGIDNVGGLVGYIGGRSYTTMSYSTGTVSGDGGVGGLVGGDNRYRYGLVDDSRCFWDVESSGIEAMGPYWDTGTGLTTAQMQDMNTFLNEGWDLTGEILNGRCDYWEMTPGDYPRLHYGFDHSAEMPEGLGTPDEPYLIQNARDLGNVWFEPLARYRLAVSIDLSEITWPIAVVPWFKGTLDGDGYAISNLRIEGGRYLGLFGVLAPEATVLNVSLDEVDVVGIVDYVGSLAGENRGNIIASYSTGNIEGRGDIGGLVGYNNGGTIEASSSSGVVVGRGSEVGGLVGLNEGGYVGASFSEGSVTTGGNSVGGLIGENEDGIIVTSFSSATISGHRWVGGLVGANRGYVSNSYSTGMATGNQSVGGFVGSNSGACYSSFWDTETSAISTSKGGTGLTTVEMQTASIFLEAGWDFMDETDNGTEDIWWVLEGQDYPRLWWEEQPTRLQSSW